jgi:Uma2 family endonuclease
MRVESDRAPAPFVAEAPMTYEDYARMPYDGYRYELVDMRLEVLEPSSSTSHQSYLSKLYEIMQKTCEQEYLILFSPLDVILSERDVRQPDLLAVHRGRLDIVKEAGIFGVPDLAVEILSPWSTRRDRKGKLETYQRYAVPEYWILDPPAGTLELYRYQDGLLRLHDVFTPSEQDHLTSPGLPCVSFSLSRLLESVPRFG